MVAALGAASVVVLLLPDDDDDDDDDEEEEEEEEEVEFGGYQASGVPAHGGVTRASPAR